MFGFGSKPKKRKGTTSKKISRKSNGWISNDAVKELGGITKIRKSHKDTVYKRTRRLGGGYEFYYK